MSDLHNQFNEKCIIIYKLNNYNFNDDSVRAFTFFNTKLSLIEFPKFDHYTNIYLLNICQTKGELISQLAHFI